MYGVFQPLFAVILSGAGGMCGVASTNRAAINANCAVIAVGFL